jgi:hypothetical protein
MNTKEFMRLYKYNIYKIIIKSCIFTIITVPIYYSIIDNDNSTITYPFSAYTSLFFYCIDTNIFIEFPLMLLAINSFLVWSIPDNRTSVINFLDLTCIFWIMICYITCLNYTKTYNTIFKNSICKYYIDKLSIYINYTTNLFKQLSIYDKKSFNFNHVITNNTVPVLIIDNPLTDQNNLYINEELINHNHVPVSIIDKPFNNNYLYTYFNYEYLLIPIDACIVFYIIIVLNTSLKQQMINFLNDNMNTLVGSLVLYALLVVPTHYKNKQFLIGYVVMVFGFLLKILYMLNVMNIDIATGIFHMCAVFSCQIFSIIINENRDIIY